MQVYELMTPHGSSVVNEYRVLVSQEMRNTALDFAQKIITTNNQYSRLLPHQVRGNASLQQQLEIQRTYIGKLGEIIFLRFLQSKGKNVDVKDMFQVFEGQSNVDSFDFETKDGKTVDIKAGFRKIHTRLLVNIEQFQNIPKDFYVAVLFNSAETDSNSKLIDLNSVTTCVIKGYASWHDLNSADVRNFGEGPAKFISYNALKGIDDIINKF